MKISELDPQQMTALLGAVSEISLVLNAEGHIVEVSTSQDMMGSLGCQNWAGRAWADTVTVESLPKIQALLQAPAGADLTWRHVNHNTPTGSEVAVQYITLPLKDGKRLAVGRNLERLVELQQRLVETQQTLERDYLRLRHIEARYRALFESSPDAIVVVDAKTNRILETNRGVQALFKDASKRLVGKDLRDCFQAPSADDVSDLIRAALATGRIELGQARLSNGQSTTLSAVVFRQEGGAQLLVRMTPQDAPVAEQASVSSLSAAMAHFPDAWVITTPSGVVKDINEEGQVLLGLTSASQATGQSLEQWLSRGAVDWGVFNTALKQHQPVRNFATEVKTWSGVTQAVEVSAVQLKQPEPLYAFILRDADRTWKAQSPTPGVPTLTQWAQWVGRRSLRDITSETTEQIERACIEAALQLTHDNRASAADMLGLSRQSLYVKLRKFDMLSDTASADDPE
jgi:transcriptional regulator PpsR